MKLIENNMADYLAMNPKKMERESESSSIWVESRANQVCFFILFFDMSSKFLQVGGASA